MKPPLTVKEYFFPFVQVSADPEYTPGEQTKKVDFETKVGVDHNPENGLYQVNLEITALPENENEKTPYAIHLIAVGLFTVSDQIEDPEKLLKITGASILYGAAREFLITITSRGPWPPFFLPTISFLPSPPKGEELEKPVKGAKKAKKIDKNKTSPQ